MITIEQIDDFMRQTGASYELAKYYLKENKADVDAAVRQYRAHQSPKQSYSTQDFVDAIKSIVAKGSATSLKILNAEGKTVLNLSLAISTLGAALIPYLSLINLGTMAISDYTFLIEKEDGSVINVKDWLTHACKEDDDDQADKEAKSTLSSTRGSHDYY